MKKAVVLALALALSPLFCVVRPAAGAQTPGRQQQQAQVFTGRIMQRHGRYLFQDASTGAFYLLDNQDKARPFAGKEVTVTGNLDAFRSTIHVSGIQVSL